METHATGVGAAIGVADHAPEIIVPLEGGGDLGLQSIETIVPEGGELCCGAFFLMICMLFSGTCIMELPYTFLTLFPVEL